MFAMPPENVGKMGGEGTRMIDTPNEETEVGFASIKDCRVDEASGKHALGHFLREHRNGRSSNEWTKRGRDELDGRLPEVAEIHKKIARDREVFGIDTAVKLNIARS